jgi:hypothetical protein
MDKDSTAMGDADIKGLASRAAPPILKAERARYAIVDHHKIYDARPLGSSQVLFALVSA